MIGVKFIGRLGNQLFQIVFLQYLQSNNPNKKIFFVNPHHSYIAKYFDLGEFHNITLNSKIYSLFTRALCLIFKFDEEYIQSIQVPRKVIVKKWKLYKGFYQTDYYLNNTPRPLNIRVKPRFKRVFQEKYGYLFNENRKNIVVHIRRTDYLTYGKRDISLPIEYFKERINNIKDVDTFQVIFVSDDMEYVKANFPDKTNYFFLSNDEITDFQLIMNADIAIISNSSFSWWAAYLSKKNNVVYAPKNWLGFRLGKEHPKKIMTERFIWCDVPL